MMTKYDSEIFPMSVTEEEDGSFTFEWDENDPRTSMFNTWTNDDFLEALRKFALNDK